MVAHAGRDQVLRQRLWKGNTLPAALLPDEIHGNGELVLVKLALAVDICQVPDLSQRFLRKL